jgi:8-oxo-dGTP pyrophosphatase MutT (NUDIX family)
MAQMYKIFINEKPLFLTNEIAVQDELNFYFLEKTDIIGLIKKYFTNKIESCYLYHPDESQLIKLFKKKLDIEKAGGGVVYNKKGHTLFIFRNGKWDLPKGGQEKNEKMRQTALREVEEETGIGNLKIMEKLSKTYHVFKRNGRYKLKITQWYWMHSSYVGEPIAQTEEGIEQVKWVPVHQLDSYLDNSYQNILLIFEEMLSKLSLMKTN